MAVHTVARILSILALAAVIVPVAAKAEQASVESPVIVVSTSGLNPANARDQAVLRHRIAVATHKLCDQVTQGDPMTSPGYAACVSRAMADARPQLDNQIAMATSRAMVASVTPK
jgi:UrcA family protein